MRQIKRFPRAASLLLTVLVLTCLIAAAAEPALADYASNATVPVTLTVANQYKAVNVTVPAALPVEVNNGVVVTADNAYIVNNASAGSVQVTGVTVTEGSYQVGNYDNFSGSKTIALSINGCSTRGKGPLTISSTAFPPISAGGQLKLNYAVKVSADAPNEANVQAANITFTISVVG